MVWTFTFSQNEKHNAYFTNFLILVSRVEMNWNQGIILKKFFKKLKKFFKNYSLVGTKSSDLMHTQTGNITYSLHLSHNMSAGDQFVH